MPYFRIDTNQEISGQELPGLLEKTTDFVAETLGKNRQYVMVEICCGKAMAFGGTTEPTALATLKSIDLDSARCPPLTAAICAFLEKEFSTPPDRVFVDFHKLDGALFGWNNKTFA